MEEIAAANKHVYEQYGEVLAQKYASSFPKNVREYARRFVRALPGKTVLDVGCGPGTHALYFSQVGLDVTCIDISETMLKKCEVKGLKTLLVDLQEMRFPDRTIDGIWAITSLVHIQKKNLASVVKKWCRMLRANGIIFISVHEGEKEGFEIKSDLPQAPRWFAYYTDEEIKRIFSQYFEVLFTSRDVMPSGNVFLVYMMRKV